MAYKNLVDLHNEHRYWLNQFDLYQDEIKYFQHQLAKIAPQIDSSEHKDEVQYFKEQWIAILAKIDNYRHQVYAHETRLYRKLELANRTKDHVITEEEHHVVKNEMEAFSMEYKALKVRYQEFVKH